MFTSVLTSRRRAAGRSQPAGQHYGGRRGIARGICVAVAAGAALTTAGLAGAATPAMAATHSLGSPIYTGYTAGYHAQGRLFRFASTTLTVAARTLPTASSGDAVIGIYSSCPGECRASSDEIFVSPGGGPGSVGYQGSLRGGPFKVSPNVGDQLTVSVYYDRHGHDYFTVTDLTQHTTQTIRDTLLTTMHPAYDHAELHAVVIGDVAPPAADTRLWHFTNSHLTTYSGVHGTIVGPWTTSEMIKTTDGTSSGAVVASPSRLYNGGQDFGLWLRHQ
jgi:hypothetical protein